MHTINTAITRLCHLAGVDETIIPEDAQADLLIRLFANLVEREGWQLTGGKWRLKDDTRDLCPFCAQHPQQHNEGICRECHLRRLVEVYERRQGIIELEREWDVARQRVHRNGNGQSERPVKLKATKGA